MTENTKVDNTDIKTVDVKVGDEKGKAIAERRPLSPLSWFDAFDSLFPRRLSDWFFTPFDDVMSMSVPEYRIPAMDIEESETEYKVRAELPGLAKDDVKVELERGILRISAEKKEETETKDKHFLRKERRHESFHREFGVPDDVDMSKDIEAKLEDGLLHITMKRVPPAPVEKKEIEVQ
ncbi:MAG: Hsp20/alpha crystallin family protein [Candidatus Lokiarchaeota archaeon]|nr:Hsp20/alpha crystallin family protein [Candidatus Lokiarchaeota archaeon]